MAKIFYILFGFMALGLGLAGIVLPLLPTTPLILLACFCFAKGSDRFHRWLLGTWFYKKYVSEFAKSRAMTLRAKISICAAASVLVAVPFVFAPFWVVRVVIALVLGFKWYYFIFRIETNLGQKGTSQCQTTQNSKMKP